MRTLFPPIIICQLSLSTQNILRGHLNSTKFNSTKMYCMPIICDLSLCQMPCLKGSREGGKEGEEEGGKKKGRQILLSPRALQSCGGVSISYTNYLKNTLHYIVRHLPRKDGADNGSYGSLLCGQQRVRSNREHAIVPPPL